MFPFPAPRLLTSLLGALNSRILIWWTRELDTIVSGKREGVGVGPDPQTLVAPLDPPLFIYWMPVV